MFWRWLSRGDTESALALHTALEQAGVDSWIDTADIRGGSNWLRDITEALIASKIVVLLLSSHSNKSQFVHNEITIANEEKKAILPIMIEDVPLASTIRPLIAIIQRLDATSKPFNQHLPRIVGVIRSALLNGSPQVVTEFVPKKKSQSPRTSLIRLSALGGIGGILIAFLVLFLSYPVKETDIQLELELHGLSMHLSSDRGLLFEEPLTPVSLAVSGLSGIDWSSQVRLPVEAQKAKAIWLETTNKDSNKGQIGFNIQLPEKSRMRIIPSRHRDSFIISFWNLGEFVPDVTVRGNIRFVPQKYGVHEMNVGTSQIQFLPESQNEMALEIKMVDQGLPVTMQNLYINELQTTLLDLADQLDNQPGESMIKSGTVYFPNARKSEYQFTNGEELKLETIEGVITSLLIEENNIKISFNGRAKELQSGFSNSFTSLMPTRFQQLMPKASG